ncbi:MAG: SGNH/GDSL hydrolase family protein [Cellulosilyticaceae bacterium]
MLITKNSTLIMIGDSVTDCGRLMPEGEGTSVSGAWGNGYVELVRGYLSAFYPECNIRIINKGINGQQASDLLVRWQEDVLDYEPEWVSILIGINDVWRVFDAPHTKEIHGDVVSYEESLRRMIEKTLLTTRNIVIMSPYMVEINKNDPMRKMMDEFGSVCERLSKEYDLKFVDLQKAFDKLLEHTHSMAICWDRIHPNTIGHTLIAHSFLEAVEAK